MTSSSVGPADIRAWAEGHGFTVLTDKNMPGQMLVQDAFGTGIPVRVVFFADQNLVWLQVELSQVVPEERWREVSHALSLVNASAFLGSWNLKTSTGKLYYKITVPSDATYGPDVLDRLFKVLVSTVLQSGQPLLRVIGGAAAESVRAA